MDTKEMIQVMSHLVAGGIVQQKYRTGSEWSDITNSKWNEWNFEEYEYRIKPKETLEDRIKAAYPGYEVVMLERNKLGNLCIEWHEFADIPVDHHGNITQTKMVTHVSVQSMKGFAGYVYEDDIEDKAHSGHPVKVYGADDIRFPVAVLF